LPSKITCRFDYLAKQRVPLDGIPAFSTIADQNDRPGPRPTSQWTSLKPFVCWECGQDALDALGENLHLSKWVSDLIVSVD
jgi:hypothetical protein